MNLYDGMKVFLACRFADDAWWDHTTAGGVGDISRPSWQLSQSRPSQLNCYGPQGTWEKNSTFNSNIMDLNKIVQKPVHGTTIEPHDGQPWSMRNEKQVLKMPGVDHPIFSVDEETEYVETKKK